MLKVMIVDDEKNTRDSLKEFLPWNEMGVSAVETAKNGQAALDQALEMQPDILLTDVRMPKMDGIELAFKIRELYPDCKIIFLSGYADKEYLKQAIHLSAVSYIEKPINMGEIKSVLLKAISQHHEDTAKKAETLKLRDSIKKSIPLIRQEIVLELIKEYADISALMENFGGTFFSLSPNSSYISAFIKINWKPSLDIRSKDELKDRLFKLFSAPDSIAFHGCLAGFDTNDNLILIFQNENGTNETVFENLLAHLIEISEDRYRVSIGIGSCVEHLSLVSASYRLAVRASMAQFYLGLNQMIHYDALVSHNFLLDDELYYLFRNYLNADKKDEAVKLITTLTDDIKSAQDGNISYIKNIYYRFILILYEVAKDRGLQWIHDEENVRDIQMKIDEAITLTEVSELVLSSVSTVLDSIEDENTINRKIYEVMKFINENYAHQELSTQTIAAFSGYSKTYLCTLFKKSTGKTLNEYITEVRMEKAKEMLKGGKLKFYEIANTLGYTDANYFSTLFKRYTGCTPSEFLEKYYL